MASKQIRIVSDSFLGIPLVLGTGLTQKNMIGNEFLVQSLVIGILDFMHNHAKKTGEDYASAPVRPAAS